MSTPSGSQPQPKEESVTGCNLLQCRCGRHWLPQRIVLAILLHLCLQNNFNTRVVLNVAIVEMVAPSEHGNITSVACPEFGTPAETEQGGKFPWPQQTTSLVLYAFYIGYTVTQVPGGMLADKFGGRYVIIGSVVMTTICTAAFPFMTHLFGYLAAVGLRFLLGVAHGASMPSISSMVSKWFPPDERPTLGGLAFAGTNLGTILGNLITGVLIQTFDGWPIAFYFWAGYSGFYFLLILLLLFSYPDTHPYIMEEEVEYLKTAIAGNRPGMKKSVKPPWKGILTNLPYWANIAAQFGHNYIYFSLITYLPTYMREILQFDVSHDGVFASVPFIALWITSLILTATARYFIRCMNEKNFIRWCGAGSNVASSALVLGAVYAGCNRYLCIGLYIVSMIVKAFYYVTLPVNINALTKNYAGILFGICNAIGSLSGIIGNFLIGYITKNKQLSEWRLVFWITLGISCVTTVFFFIFASIDRQAFDYDENEPRET